MAPPNDELNPRFPPIARILPKIVVRPLPMHFYAGVKHAEVAFRFEFMRQTGSILWGDHKVPVSSDA
jgi:hypothetical protein